MAAGRWARRAIGSWNRRYPEPEHLLVGETPFIGHRFIELARRMDDEAEPLLRGASCRFAVPVPSVDVRRFLETQRERRALQPLHPREREDAAPSVLRVQGLGCCGVALGLVFLYQRWRAGGRGQGERVAP